MDERSPLAPRAVARDDRRRCFILTCGRTGSTLLAAILADCGAEFGMPAPLDWDASGGDLEHRDLQSAARWLARAYTISPEKPELGWRRYMWSIYRSRGKRKLRHVLAQARYLKCVDLDLTVYPAVQLGYRPSIVLSYRRFEDATISGSLTSGNSDMSLSARRYNRIYRNGLLQLSTFGGCAIGFDQLTDPADTSWAEPLAGATGIAAAQLVEARGRRLKPLVHTATTEILDRAAWHTFEQVDALRGIAVASSAPAVRFASARKVAAPASQFAGGSRLAGGSQFAGD